jgi:hypothetical protein
MLHDDAPTVVRSARRRRAAYRGGRVQVLHRVLAWNTTTEFPADFEFQIAYDPDILRDGNPANDDARAPREQ